MGSLRKRPTGTWEARWYGSDGKQHSKNFRTRAAAKTFMTTAEHKSNNRQDRHDEKRDTPFNEVADKWFEWIQNRKADPVKPKTIAGYSSILKTHLRPAFGTTPIGELDVERIEDFIAKLPKTLSPMTVGNILRTLSPIMTFALRRKYIDVNPFPSAEGRPKSRRPDPMDLVFLTPSQVGELAQEVGPRYSTLIRTAAYTGARAGELAALRVRDFDPLHRKLTVRESAIEIGGHITLGKPKNGTGRTYKLAESYTKMLSAKVEGKRPDEFIFGNHKPLRHSNFYGRVFRPAVLRLVESGQWPSNLGRLRFHDLRHTCASILLANGANMKAVQEWLGHSSYQITADRYSHLYDGHQDDIADRMEAAFAVTAAVGVTPIR